MRGEEQMRNRQQGVSRQHGVSIMGLIIGLVVLVVLALVAMKIGPPYMEFNSAKKLAHQIVNEMPNGSAADIRRAWNLRQGIQDVSAVGQGDLQISRENNQNVIAFQYRKEVPLVANLGVYMDFAVNTGSGK